MWGCIPRVACFARNPGLGNRNSYRVAAAYVVFAMKGMLFVRMDVGVAAAYEVFVMVGIMFVCMDVGVAAACVVLVMVGIMFLCLDVGCILMPGFTNINDISSPSWMVRTPGNSVGVAIS